MFKKKMNIFADLHHSGLYASLKYLFEDRLGYNLYRPIGTEWFEKGFWDIAKPYGNNAGTVAQYLTESYIPSDGTPPLNIPLGKYQYDTFNDIYHKAITLEEFIEMDIDIIIASIPDHVLTYKRLIREHKPNAKLIYQIGNIGWQNEIDWREVDNLMASVKEFPIPDKKNAVFYRQEFNTRLFRPEHPGKLNSNKIISFVHLLPEPDKFFALEKELKEYEFKSYGISCRDGIKQSDKDIANTMKSAVFAYHNKPHGDGFGHTIHNWMALGIPTLVNLGDYKDKLAGELLTDGVTCIDIDNKSTEEVAEIIRGLHYKGYLDMRVNILERYNKVVDYKADALKVSKFIERLV